MMPSTPEQPAPAPRDEAADWQTVRQLAHDLNNLIGAIGGYAEMLIEDAPRNAALAADLNQIREAANRAATIVNTLRTLARQAGAAAPSPSGDQ